MAGRDYTPVFFRSARKTVSNGKKAPKPFGYSIYKALGQALFRILHRRLPEHHAVGVGDAHIFDDHAKSLAENLDPGGWLITVTIITTMNANTPPPLPPEQIRCVRFEGEKMGLHTANFDRTRLEMAQQKALQWMSAHPSAEIISVDSCFGNLIVIVTIWYRP